MPRGRRPVAAAAAEERCSFEAHRPKSFECSSTATFVSTSCETSTLRAGFLRRRHTLSCSFSRLLKIPHRRLRASDPSSSSKVYIEGPGESERERYILDSLTGGSYGHGGLKHVSSDSSLFTDATWRSTPPTSTFFPRQSAGGSFSSTVAPSISQHSSSASLSAIAAALSTSTTPSGLHTSHFFSASSAPPSTPRLQDWHGFNSDAQVSRSEFWCVLRAGLDVHKYRSEVLQPPPSPPPACSRLQRAGSQPVNSLKPPTHPNLQRSKSTGKVLQLKRLYREPPAVSDEGCGMVTLFLDEGGERLCWCTPGKALLRPNAAHCIFLSSICGVTVDDSGSSSSSKRERSHSRSFGSDVSGNSSDSSSCSSSAGAPQQQQQQQQRAVRQQGTTITLHCRSRARPLKLSVDGAHIRTLLAGGFRKLAERNNALHANSVLASAQSTQQHISEQQQQLFEEAVAAATAADQEQQQQQQYQQQYRQQQQQHTRVLSGAFCAVPAMKGDLAPAAVAVAAATAVAAVAVEQQQPQQQQLQQQRTAVALSH
jgi:hypothetical protein